jgi:MFS family permease
VFSTQLGCGAVDATLGMFIPFLSYEFGVPCADLGIVLTLSGLGYYCGVMVNSKINNRSDPWFLDVPMIWLLVASAWISGLACFALIVASNLWLIKALVFVQFVGLAGIDTLGTVVLAEMWGQRVQPWMQAKSAFFAFGGLIPPLVGLTGISTPLAVTGVLCMSAILGGGFDAVYTALFATTAAAAPTPSSSPPVKDVSGTVTMTEATPLISARDRARSRASSTSVPTSPGSGSFFTSMVAAVHLESDELAMLEYIIETNKNGDSTVESPGANSVLVGDIVTTVLDATPYCDITEEERNDPAFQPFINKTLSFATQPIVSAITRENSCTDRTLGARRASHVDDMRESIALVPITSQYLLALLIFFNGCSISTFFGWFPTYFQLKDFQGAEWEGMGTQIISTFFASMAVGCIVSIPFSVWVSITKLLRFHLAMLSCGGLMLQLAAMVSAQPIKIMLLAGAAMMGYGISAVFPLAVTVVNDYGFTMDATVTFGMLKGLAIGGILIPILLGYLMRLFGPGVLTLSLCVLGLCEVVVYLLIHINLARESEDVILKAAASASASRAGAVGSDTDDDPFMSAHHNAKLRLQTIGE